MRGLFKPISVGETSSSVVVICSGSSDIVTAVESNQTVLQCEKCVRTNDQKGKECCLEDAGSALQYHKRDCVGIR